MINQVRPWEVIQQVAEAVPAECRDNIIIILDYPHFVIY